MRVEALRGTRGGEEREEADKELRLAEEGRCDARHGARGGSAREPTRNCGAQDAVRLRFGGGASNQYSL